MCPDTHEKNEIRIYKCEEFPMVWKFHKTIMRGVPAVDTSIFEFEGLWWMLSNIDYSDARDFACQLHVFSSKNPLSESWAAHKGNPVIFDPLRARNAGLINDGNKVFRAYQRQGFNRYGEAVGVAEIQSLTLNNFEEVEKFHIEPEFFRDIEGTHTFNAKSGLVVFDTVSLKRQ